MIDHLPSLPEPGGLVDGVLVPGDPANGVVVGRSGNGWRPSIDFPNFPPSPPPPLPPSPPPPPQLTRGSALVRGTRSDGFYLACSILLPAKPSGVIPLVLIGENESPSASQCFLALEERTVVVQTTDPAPPAPSVPLASVMVWELVGKITDNSGQVKIFSVDHAMVSRMGVNPQPIVGGRWVDVGLLYDGKRMILYCDGERIAQLSVGAKSHLIGGDSVIYLGSMLNEITAAPPKFYANVPLDDARLYRLGTADLGELPGNVVLISHEGAKPDGDLGYRILCQPDGRVEVSRDNAVGGNIMNDPLSTNPNYKVTTGSREGERATITIGQLRTPSALQAAEITVTLDGRVTSRLLTHAQAVAPK